MAKRKKPTKRRVPRTVMGRIRTIFEIAREIKARGGGKTKAAMRREVKAELKREFGDGTILAMLLKILELLLPLLLLL